MRFRAVGRRFVQLRVAGALVFVGAMGPHPPDALLHPQQKAQPISGRGRGGDDPSEESQPEDLAHTVRSTVPRRFAARECGLLYNRLIKRSIVIHLRSLTAQHTVESAASDDERELRHLRGRHGAAKNTRLCARFGRADRLERLRLHLPSLPLPGKRKHASIRV